MIHGPFNNPWLDSMSYDHTEWLYDSVLVAKTVEAGQQLERFGIGLALLSTFHDKSTILFAMVSGQHIFSNSIQFINHNYLFFLLSTLMALQCNCQKIDTRNKNKNDTNNGWIQALRGQIVVVYFYAALWKFDREWIDGTICKGIFLSFEETGDNRGVPWASLYAQYGMTLFMGIALGGLVLDTLLFLVLLLLPPSHNLQILGCLFHGFTGYTMSQRIGYSFPLAMIFSILLFQSQSQSAQNEDDTTTTTNDTLSHAQWLLQQMTGGTDLDQYHHGNKDNDHSTPTTTNDTNTAASTKKPEKIQNDADTTGDDKNNKNKNNDKGSSDDSASIENMKTRTTTR